MPQKKIFYFNFRILFFLNLLDIIIYGNYLFCLKKLAWKLLIYMYKEINMTKKFDNIIKVYLKEINMIPLLTPEEEIKYFKAVAKGDSEAREKILQANLRFVVSIAKKYMNQGLELDDLISEGNIGLMKALERFDLNQGYRFISYAVWWIRQSILKALGDKSRMIRLPANVINELSQIEKVKREFGFDENDPNFITLVADELGMKRARVSLLWAAKRDTVSLETPIALQRDTVELIDIIEDSHSESPESAAVNVALKDSIDVALSTLTEKEANIIRHRFGLNGYKQKSLRELAEIHNVTKERVRQIERKALGQLKENSSALLENYIA